MQERELGHNAGQKLRHNYMLARLFQIYREMIIDSKIREQIGMKTMSCDKLSTKLKRRRSRKGIRLQKQD